MSDHRKMHRYPNPSRTDGHAPGAVDPIGQHRPLTDYDRGWAEATAQAADYIRELEAAIDEWADARKSVECYGDETWKRLSRAESRLAALRADTDTNDDG